MPDGEVVIDTSVKTASAEKGYRRLIDAMEKVKREIELVDETSKRQELANNLDFARQKTDELSAKLSQLNRQKSALEAKAQLLGVSDDTNKELSKVNSEIQKTSSSFDMWVNKQDAAEGKLNANAAKESAKLENLKKKYKSLSTDLEQLVKKQGAVGKSGVAATAKTAKGATAASKAFGRLSVRMRQIVSSALIFNIISAGLRIFTQYIGRALKSNAQFQSALSRLQGSLLTAFQPIWELIVPGIIWLIDVLATAAGWLAKFTSLLTGKSVAASSKSAAALNSQAGGMEGLNEETKAANSSMASFDELNTIDKNSDKKTGGAGVSSAPSFLPEQKQNSEWLSLLQRGFAALGRIIAVVADGCKMFYDSVLGPLLERLVEMGKGALAWLVEKLEALATWMEENPEKVAEFITILGTVALVTAAAFGAYKAFGFFLTIVKAVFGFLSSGIGIILLVVAALTAIVVATGNGQRAIDALMNILNGFLTFVEGVFSGNMDLAMQGLGQMFQGLLDLCIVIFESLDMAFGACMDWIIEKLGITDSSILQIFEGLKKVFSGIIEFLVGVFTGDWEKAWNGIKNIVCGIWDVILGTIKAVINLIVDLVNSLLGLIEGGINGITGGINSVTKIVGIPAIPQLSIPRIPHLARGAVIPPNRKFMAVLGDQRHGTNIETPEGLLRQIMREENSGVSEYLIREILAVLREIRDNGGDIVIGDDVIGRAAHRYEDNFGVSVNSKFAHAY